MGLRTWENMIKLRPITGRIHSIHITIVILVFTLQFLINSVVVIAKNKKNRINKNKNKKRNGNFDLSTITTNNGKTRKTKIMVQVKKSASSSSILSASLSSSEYDNTVIKETMENVINIKDKSNDKDDDTVIMGYEIISDNNNNTINSIIDSLLYNNSNIVFIEPDYTVSIFENNNANNKSNKIKKRMKRELQDFVPWGIDTVLQNQRSRFFNTEAKGKVKICIADTGYDINHDDLPGGDNPGSVKGINRLGENWYYDGQGHGTHVAGTIAAISGNNGGVYGLLPKNYNNNFELLIAKAFDETGSGLNSQVMVAVEDCIKMGATVISMSLGCNSCYSSIYDNYLQNLYNDNILLVAAAGNAGTSDYAYPASYSSVISVASIEYSKTRSPFSQYNYQVEISAPGSGIWSTIPDNEYQIKDGTSMATPHVAGVAGLLRMFYPQCTAQQIRLVLAYTALDIGYSGCDRLNGFGLLQGYSAFELIRANSATCVI